MRCPRDGTDLTSTADAVGPGTRAQVCPRCAGVMVDWETARTLFRRLRLELTDLQSLVRKAERRARPGPPAACTACQQGPLRPFTVQGVELDLCEACGAAWFDRGELARLTHGELGASLAPAPLAPGETSEVVGVFEMLWDCAYCGTRALKGASNAFCPQCGAQQDASRRYFPPEGQESPANLTYEGADTLCPACATPNGARANNCRSCGSPLSGAAEVARVADRAEGAPPPREARAAVPAAAASGRRLWPYALGAVAVLGLGALATALLWKKDVALTVVGHAWTREVAIEQLRAVPDSAWCDSLPGGAYAVSRSREQRSSRQVPDGQDCSTRDVDRGNGTFERRRECRPRYRSEPVYDERCHFTVDRWQVVRTATASGAGLDPPPRWPPVQLSGRAGLGLGAEREGSRSETYTLTLRGPEAREYRCAVSPGRWAEVPDGAQRPVKVGVLTGAVECDKL